MLWKILKLLPVCRFDLEDLYDLRQPTVRLSFASDSFRFLMNCMTAGLPPELNFRQHAPIPAPAETRAIRASGRNYFIWLLPWPCRTRTIRTGNDSKACISILNKWTAGIHQLCPTFMRPTTQVATLQLLCDGYAALFPTLAVLLEGNGQGLSQDLYDQPCGCNIIEGVKLVRTILGRDGNEVIDADSMARSNTIS